MKDDLHVTRWVLISGIFLLLMIAYSILNYVYLDARVSKTDEIESYFSNLNDSISSELVTLDKEDSLLLVDSTSQNILFIGDSMAEGLQFSMRDYAKQSNHQINIVAERSASIQSWVGREGKGRLRDSIESINPTYVLVCLGSNELFTRSLKQYRKYVENILDQAQDRKLVWIGPPKWKEDFGLTHVIEEVVGSDRYFPSETVKLKRAGDGIHPTMPAYATWTDSLTAWMTQYTRHKIYFEKPITQ